MATGNRQPAQRPRTENEDISLEQRMNQVLAELNLRKAEIAAALSADMPFDVFFGNINQALRNNPKLLNCTFPSLVNACVKSAYDGLRIDGKEAAIVDHSVKISKNPDRWEQQAQYFPMVFGLIKQILQSGAALQVKAVIVYERETTEISKASGRPRFMLLEGTTPGIHHEPILVGEKGPMVGAYAIAEIQIGVFKFEWMDKPAILEVMAEAKTKKVWERWPTEMWKKTVVRRLRKSLVGARKYDAEAIEMFPQFQPNAGQQALAAPPPRPTREAIGHQGGASGVAMDFGRQPVEHDDDGVVVEQGGGERQTVKVHATRSGKTVARENSIPEDEVAWVAWVREIEARVAAANTTDDVEKIRADEGVRIEAATANRSGWVKGMISDRLADLVSDTAEGSAPADGEPAKGQE